MLMKKIFITLFVLMFSVIGTFAQTFLYEDFEDYGFPAGWTMIDNDGDGHNWQMKIGNPVLGAYQSDGCIASPSWDNYSLNSDNWLITPALHLENNATLTFYAAGHDYEYARETFSICVSTTGTNVSDFTTVYTDSTLYMYQQYSVDLSDFNGQTVYIAFRHQTNDHYWITLDNVRVFAQPQTPTVDVNTHTVAFDSIPYPGAALDKLDVTGYLLTNSINATVSGPFTISANNQTFGTTATLPQAGASLYIRYEPSQVGQATGTITLTSAGAPNVTINLSASSYNCDNKPLPYFCDFTNADVVKCWNTVDVDLDGDCLYFGSIELTSDYGYIGYGVSPKGLPANDWLISPSFTVGVGAAADFECSVAEDQSHQPRSTERFEVYAIPEGHTYSDATLVLSEQEVSTVEWESFRVKLANFIGQKIQIGIHIVSDPDAFCFYLTNFKAQNEVLSVEEINNTVNIYPNPANQLMNVRTTSNMRNIEVYSLAGNKVANYDGEGIETSINVSGLSNGLYLMRIHTDNGVINQKFSIVR